MREEARGNEGIEKIEKPNPKTILKFPDPFFSNLFLGCRNEHNIEDLSPSAFEFRLQEDSEQLETSALTRLQVSGGKRNRMSV